LSSIIAFAVGVTLGASIYPFSGLAWIKGASTPTNFLQCLCDRYPPTGAIISLLVELGFAVFGAFQAFDLPSVLGPPAA